MGDFFKVFLSAYYGHLENRLLAWQLMHTFDNKLDVYNMYTKLD